MRAVICDRLGSPRGLRVEPREPRPPGPGELSVLPRAWGLNYVDVLMVAGGYQLRPELPFTPGLEASGVVDALGEGVQGLAPGDRVIVAMRPGTFAEQLVVPVTSVVAMPASMTMEQAACFRSAFATAYYALVQGSRLAGGEIALIHGATGGMGMAAIQVAKQLGATVIATGASAQKLQTAKAYGADHVICCRDGFRHAVRALTGGVDVVFDPVGGDVFDESMRCLNWGARLLVVGFTGGRPAAARTNHVLIKGASVIGIRAGEFARRRPRAARENLAILLGWADAGRISSHISHRFPLARVADAMQVILDREVIGRVVMHP